MPCPHEYENADYCPDCQGAADAHWLRAECARLEAENARLRAQVAGHAERIAAQSELLSRRAEQPWGDEPPAVPGWYWWRRGDYVAIVRLVHVDRDDAGEWEIEKAGDDMPYRLADYANGQWSGPVEPPA